MSKKKTDDPVTLGEVLAELPFNFNVRGRQVRRAVDYLAVGTPVGDQPSRTKIGDADHVNINNIIRRARLTGQIDHVKSGAPAFGAWDGSLDFMEARLRMEQAEDAFMELPSNVRGLVDNDPAKFIDFLNDPENAETLRSEGLEALVEHIHPDLELPPSETPPTPPTDEAPPSASSDETPPEETPGT